MKRYVGIANAMPDSRTPRRLTIVIRIDGGDRELDDPAAQRRRRPTDREDPRGDRDGDREHVVHEQRRRGDEARDRAEVLLATRRTSLRSSSTRARSAGTTRSRSRAAPRSRSRAERRAASPPARSRRARPSPTRSRTRPTRTGPRRRSEAPASSRSSVSSIASDGIGVPTIARFITSSPLAGGSPRRLVTGLRHLGRAQRDPSSACSACGAAAELGCRSAVEQRPGRARRAGGARAGRLARETGSGSSRAGRRSLRARPGARAPRRG